MQDETNDGLPTDELGGSDPLNDQVEDFEEDSVEDSVENSHENSVQDSLRGYLEDPLEAVKIIIEKWEKAIKDYPESLFLLNEAQCTKMWQNFRRVYEAFEPSSSYPREYKNKCLHVFIEFHRIVERGGAVMDMCTKVEAERGGVVQNMGNKQVSWLKAAILYGDNERMFQELSDNLQLCVDCACELTKSLSFPSSLRKLVNHPSSSQKPVDHLSSLEKSVNKPSSQKSVDHLSSLEKSVNKPSSRKPLIHVDVALLPSQAGVEFKRDFARLRAKLEHLVKEHAGPENDEVHLAQYFLDRETFRSKSHPEIQARNVRPVCSASQDPSPSEATLPEKYFEKNRHYPMEGDNHKAGGEGTVVCTVNWLGLKCFKKKFDKDVICEEYLETFMANFQKEVNVLERLNHCNIVRLFCSLSKEPSIVMEFVEIDLRKFLMKRKKKRISFVAAVDIMLQMALGMEYSHDQGVVHRDLKSSNILVSPSRHPSLEELGYVDVKVTDFGIAKVNELIAAMPTDNMMGTTGWRAPEVEKGHIIDWRLADTYSFAITCVEILTLQTPRVGGQRPVLPGDCPDYLRELLERCGDENPKKRLYFKDIVWTLKKMKRHLLSANLLMLRQSQAKNLSSLTMDRGESDVFKATVASIERRLKLAKSVFKSMTERQRQVIICPTQCCHLVGECKSGLKQVTSAYYSLDPKTMVNLFHSKDKNLQGLARSLDGLICSLMASEELVGSCSGPHQWKIMAIALCAPPPTRQACSRFGYCLWELYWSLYVTRSHLDATFLPERGPIMLTNLSFKWSKHNCEFVCVAKPIVIKARDTEIEYLEEDREGEFTKADKERQFQDCKLLLTILQNSTLEIPRVKHCHRTMPTTKVDITYLLPEVKVVLRRRLESKCLETVQEPESHLSLNAFYDLNDQILDGIPKNHDYFWQGFYGLNDHTLKHISKNYDSWRRDWYECWGWGIEMMRLKTPWIFLGEILVEIEIMGRVQHPNIVNLIGFQGEGRHSKSPTMIFELVTTTMEDLIKSNMAFFSGSSPFPFPVTLDILLQIVEAMIHVQQCGVVHLNLNPKKILVQPKNTIDSFGTADLDLHSYYTVKLAGFNEAILVNPNGPLKRDDSFDVTPNLLYLPHYSAPELWGRGQFTKFVDVWSFGITAYHIVSGSRPFELPFESLDFCNFWKQVKGGERQFPLPLGATFPGGLGLKTLIEKCCVFDPYARISFEEIRKELWTLRKNYDIDGLQE